MSWQLDLTDEAIHALQIVAGAPRQIAVWLDESTVRFYAVDSGGLYGSLTLDSPREFAPLSGIWRRFVDSLRLPHGDFLPYVTANGLTILTSYDGRLRLYCERGHRLILESDGQPGELVRRDDESLIVAVALDRDLGTVAALSAAGKLHLYQQHVYIGHFALEAVPATGLRSLFAPDAGGEIVVVTESSIQIVDLSGAVPFRIVSNEANHLASCTTSGNILAISESDQTVLSVYDSKLQTRYQGHARALLDKATPLQLIMREPTQSGPLDALAIDNDGVLVFALDGIVCCSHIDGLTKLPTPTALL